MTDAPQTYQQLGYELPCAEVFRYALRQLRTNPLSREKALEILRQHPDWNTPNWCDTCSPAGRGSCHCEIASNE